MFGVFPVIVSDGFVLCCCRCWWWLEIVIRLMSVQTLATGRSHCPFAKTIRVSTVNMREIANKAGNNAFCH